MKANNKMFHQDKTKRFLFLTLCLAIISLGYSQAQSIEKMNGHYTGKGKIIVSWCEQDSLSFKLDIDDKGVVSGSIGDASIVSGVVKKNLWGSKEYIIEAELSGYLVANEQIKRKSIKIPFDFDGTAMTGGFGSGGSKVGGKEKMMLSGTNMALFKQL